MIKRLRLICCLLISFTLLYGQTGNPVTWDKTNGPHGGSVDAIAYHPSSGRVFALVQGVVYLSTDNGSSWQKFSFFTSSNPYDYFINDIEVSSDGDIYFLSYNYLYTSTDGITFTQENPSSKFINGEKIIKSHSSGRLLVLGSDNLGNEVIWISTDGGVNWSKGLTTASHNIVGMVSNSAGQIFTANGGNKVKVSNNGGVSFSDNSNGITDPNIISISASADGSLLYAVGDQNIWKLGTLGDYTTWIPITGGITDTYFYGYPASYVASGTTHLFFVDNYNHKFYSWDPSSLPVWPAPVATSFPASGIGSTSMAIKDDDNLFFATNGRGVFQTSNGGTTLFESVDNFEGLNFVDLLRTNSGKLLVSAYSGLYASSDDGQSWSRVSLGASNEDGIRLFKNSTTGDLYAFGYGLSMTSTAADDGASWTDLPVSAPANSQFFSFDGIKIFATGGDDQYYFSSNSGTSWSSAIAVTGLPSSFNIYSGALDESYVLFLNLYNYDDSKQELWEITFSPDPTSGTPTSGTAAKVSGGGFSATSSVSAVSTSGGKVYVLGLSSTSWVLNTSTNAGVSWTSKNINDGGYKIFAFPNDYIVILNSQSSSQRVYVSRDGGTTFDQSSMNSTGNTYYSNNVSKMIMDPDGLLYAITDYSGLFKTSTTVVTPDPPTNLVEAGHGATGLTIRFDDNSSNEQGFVIQKKIGGVYTSIDSTGSHYLTGERIYYRDRNLTPGTSYDYRVASYNGAGASAFSTVTVSTVAQTAPTIPDNHSWTGVTANIDGLATPGTNTEIAIKQISSGYYAITDVTGGILNGITGDATVAASFYESSGTTYLEPQDGPILEEEDGTWNGTDQITLFWRLDKDHGGGPYPDKYEEITLTRNASDPIPGSPTDVHAYVYDNASIEVDWTGDLYESEFIVERSTSSGGPFSEVGRVNYPSTTFLDDGSGSPLTAGETYYYQIKGSNSSGDSAPSAVSDGVTLNPPNFVLSNTQVSNNSQGSGTTFIWGDFDNDGDEDLVLVQITFFNGAATTPYAFRNDGNGTFTAVNAGFESSDYLIGTAADYDNDGNLDIFMTSTGSENYLYKGNGNFTFTKVDPNPVGENTPNFETADLAAGWMDYDNNGLVDLYVGNQSNADKLFKQNPAETFTKETTLDPVASASRTNSIGWADYDNDGDMDLFVVCNDGASVPNKLFRNNGDGTFTRVTGLVFDSDLDLGAFGCSWGDYDNDGDLDLFLTVQDGSGSNILYRNNGAASGYTFTKITSTILTDPKTAGTFGSAWGDIDNDGDLDLVISQAGANAIYLNNGSGVFTQATGEKFNDANSANLGLSLGDYDADGFLDAAVSAVNPALFNEKGFSGSGVNSQLFKNNHTAASNRNWIELKLIGTSSNKSALGARVTLTAGGKTQIREVTTTSGFAGESSLVVHFGLGSNTSITSLQVHWPSGFTQTYSNLTTINQLLTITEDQTGPVVVSYSPAQNATNVSTITSLSLQLDEASSAVTGKKLNVFLASDLSTPVFSMSVTSATKVGNEYDFTLPQRLITNTGYTISIDAGAFKDIFGNNSLAINTGTWSFTTEKGPLVSQLVPASASTGINANDDLTITFDQDVTAIAGKKITVMNGGTPVLSADVSTTGTLAGASYTLSGSNWPRATTLNVLLDDGAFVDAHGNPSAALQSGDWSFTTDGGPSVSSLSPADNASAVASNTPLVITFNRNISAASSKHLKVMDGTNTVLNVDVSTNGSVTTNSYSLPAPVAGWPNFAVLNVVVDAGAFVDSNMNEFAGIAAGGWSFTTEDITPPVFASFTPPVTEDKGFTTAKIGIGVSDNQQVSSVKFFIRKISGTTFTATSAVFNSSKNLWEATFNETSNFDATGTDYYIVATDPSGNSSTSPANSPGSSPAGKDTYQTLLNYTSDVTIDGSFIGSGGGKGDWKIFSIPFVLPNNGTDKIFDELASRTYKVDWRLITYKDQTSWQEPVSTIERGKGYFINIKVPTTISIGSPLAAPPNDRSNLFQMSLAQGWNEIGNPYLSKISWDDVKGFADNTGLSGSELMKYTGSGYSNSNQSLAPFEGGFVFVDAATTVSIPFFGQTSSGRINVHPLGHDLAGENWEIPLSLHQGDLESNYNAVGMATDASESFDAFDRITPPRFFDYLELNFDHPEFFAHKFSRDIVPTASEKEWDFTVESNQSGITTLTWDNTQFGDNSLELFLYDTDRDQAVNMRENNSYSFDLNSSRSFKIFFGTNARSQVMPDFASLGKAWPNPTSGTVNIPFTLSEKIGLSHVNLEVFDLMGKKVATLMDCTLNPDFYVSQWDARDDQVKNGLYTYRLVVSAKGGQHIYSGKLIINK